MRQTIASSVTNLQPEYYCVLVLQFLWSYTGKSCQQSSSDSKLYIWVQWDVDLRRFCYSLQCTGRCHSVLSLRKLLFRSCQFGHSPFKIPRHPFFGAASRITGSSYRWCPNIIDLNSKLTLQMFMISDLVLVRYPCCQTPCGASWKIKMVWCVVVFDDASYTYYY